MTTAPDLSKADTQATSTDELVRSLMTDEKRATNRSALPELEPIDTAPVAHQPAAPTAKHKPQRRAPKSLIGRVKAYRPIKGHIALAVLALVVVIRPWLIPAVLFVGFWVGLIVYLTMGPDRIHEYAARAWGWLNARYPARAEKLRLFADRIALKFDALLDKLPESWADRLALPDLSPEPSPLDTAPDPFDRLAKLPEVYRG